MSLYPLFMTGKEGLVPATFSGRATSAFPTCPTLIASAILDKAHPPRTVMPVFEKIGALKSIIVDPDLDNEYRTDFTHHGKEWMDRYLR